MSIKEGEERVEVEKPPIEPIRLPSPEEIRGQDIWNNCAVRSIMSGVIGGQDIWNNCAVRSIMSGVMGGSLGVMMALFFGALDNPIMQDTMTTRQQLAYTARQMGQRSWSSAKTFALMGLIFSASECVVEKLITTTVAAVAAKHDTTNSAVAGCVTGGVLAAKELQYAAATEALDPPHEYVPWVVVNGQPLYETDNFTNYVCDAYKGTPPSACTINFSREKTLRLHPVYYADKLARSWMPQMIDIDVM